MFILQTALLHLLKREIKKQTWGYISWKACQVGKALHVLFLLIWLIQLKSGLLLQSMRLFLISIYHTEQVSWRDLGRNYTCYKNAVNTNNNKNNQDLAAKKLLQKNTVRTKQP